MNTLKTKKAWIVWKYETRQGEDKPTKVPYQINGYKASSTDPETWDTYENVVKARYQFDGIGYMLIDGYVGVDIDKCLLDKIIKKQNHEKFIKEANSFTEISPSGTGLHTVFFCPDFTPVKNRKDDIEIYSNRRYFTYTGNNFGEEKVIRKLPIAELEKLLSILGYPWGDKEEKKEAVISKTNLTDDDVVDKLFSEREGGRWRKLYDGDTSEYDGDESRADAALCSKLNFYTGNDEEQTIRIWRNSPLGQRGKTQKRDDYVKRTQKNSESDKTFKSENEVLEDVFISAQDLYDMEFNTPKWIIQDIIPENGRTLIVGKSGIGKSFVALQVIKSILTQTPLFDSYVCPADHACLILDKENGLRRLRERVVNFGIPPLSKLYLNKLEYVDIYNDAYLDRLTKFIKEKEIKVVVIDSLFDFIHGDSKKAEDITIFYDKLRKCNGSCSWIIIHHEPKPSSQFTRDGIDRASGSANIVAQVNNVFILESMGEGQIKMMCVKNRDGAIPPAFSLTMETIDSKVIGFKYQPLSEDTQKETKQEKAVIWVEELLIEQRGKFRNEIIELGTIDHGLSSVSIDRALGYLTQMNRIEKKSVNRKTFYSYKGTVKMSDY